MAFEFIFPITLGLLLRILAFPQEEQLKLEIDAFAKKKIPILPLTGVDTSLFDEAKEIGLERNMKKLEKAVIITTNEIPPFSKKEVEFALKTKKKITIKIGPNNVHDILDSLENH